MSQTAYCYHCGVGHPIEETRQIMSKGGKSKQVGSMKPADLAKQLLELMAKDGKA